MKIYAKIFFYNLNLIFSIYFIQAGSTSNNYMSYSYGIYFINSHLKLHYLTALQKVTSHKSN